MHKSLTACGLLIGVLTAFIVFYPARSAPAPSQTPDEDEIRGVESIPLMRAYREYNRLYFTGTLPADVVVAWGDNLEDSASVVVREKESGHCAIFINKRLRWAPELAEILLLHEMVHVAHWEIKGDDDPRFQAAMQRLAAEGAFKGLW